MLTRPSSNAHTVAKNNRPHWFILYTAARAEKAVRDSLLEQNFEVYLPVFTSVNTWKNRQKKIIETPLFPSYVFAKGEEKQLLQMTRVPRVVTFLRSGSKPSTIRQQEIDQIKTLIGLQTELSIEPDVKQGDLVRISQGLLNGYEGVLQSRKGKDFFGIQLKDLNRTIFIQLTTSALEKIN